MFRYEDPAASGGSLDQSRVKEFVARTLEWAERILDKRD
jgi:hypothetical protein